MTLPLETEDTLLIPYARGVYARDALYHVWRLMEDEGLNQRVFWSQRCSNEQVRGDLIEVVRFFESWDPPRYLVIPKDKQTGALMGLVWFDHGGHVGQIGVCYRQAFRGKRCQEATRLACAYAYAAFGFSHLYGFTPFKEAVRHVRPLGWRRVGTLPQYAMVDGQERDIYVMMHSKE